MPPSNTFERIEPGAEENPRDAGKRPAVARHGCDHKDVRETKRFDGSRRTRPPWRADPLEREGDFNPAAAGFRKEAIAPLRPAPTRIRPAFRGMRRQAAGLGHLIGRRFSSIRGRPRLALGQTPPGAGTDSRARHRGRHRAGILESRPGRTCVLHSGPLMGIFR